MRDLFEIIGWQPWEGREIIVDSFAGGGGASLGIRMALGRDPDVAINHDPEAVAMHQANHPGTRHHCQSVWEASPRQVTFGQPVGLLWASPDCKHFSKAKGGKPVSRNIRDLAWIVVKWAREAFPRVIILENVEEFVTWGPLGPDNRPCPERKGEEFKDWVRALRDLRYTVEWRELKACDHGAPTTRKRLFVIARRDGRPIVWPEPTHGDPKSDAVRSGRLKPWRTAAECIDWSIPCPSMFERKRPLAPNTRRRIATGVRRYVIDAAEPFLVQTGYGERPGQAPRVPDINSPLGTVVGGGVKHAVCTPFLTEHANASKQRTWNIQEPLRTQCAHVKGGHFAMVAASLTKFNENSIGLSPAEPMHTVMAGAPRFAVATSHLVNLTHGGRNEPLQEPLRTVTGAHRGEKAVVAASLGAVTSVDHHSVVAANMVKLRGTSTVAPADAPLHTLSAQGTHHAVSLAHLLKYFNTATGQPLDEPAHTVTSKHRHGLVESRTGGDHFDEVKALLCEFRRKPWGFRVDEFDDLLADAFEAEVVIQGEVYRIRDIGMRMLQPRELARAQGFPDSYILDPMYKGKPLTKTAQVRMIGNSVCPDVAAALAGANVPELAEVEVCA